MLTGQDLSTTNTGRGSVKPSQYLESKPQVTTGENRAVTTLGRRIRRHDGKESWGKRVASAQPFSIYTNTVHGVQFCWKW